MNSQAGEEAVGHATVLAYVSDTDKYAKPEVDPLHYHLSTTLLFYIILFLFTSLSCFGSVQKLQPVVSILFLALFVHLNRM